VERDTASVVIGGMPFDHLEALMCKFCEGRLRFDFDRKEKAPGFTYYRCDECRVANVFAVPADATT
jgi:hypothetical protein